MVQSPSLKPKIDSFTASSLNIQSGTSITLAASVSSGMPIGVGISGLTLSGTELPLGSTGTHPNYGKYERVSSYTPTETTTYTLTLRSNLNEHKDDIQAPIIETRQVTVIVN